jgi:TRAP-type C4-dicarboxylate transport system permease small subunit
VIFAAIILCVASQGVFTVVVVVYFVIESVRKLLDPPWYVLILFYVNQCLKNLVC